MQERMDIHNTCPPISLKLLTVQVRMQLRQPQLEPHVSSKVQIICASHSYLPIRFLRRFKHPTTS